MNPQTELYNPALTWWQTAGLGLCFILLMAIIVQGGLLLLFKLNKRFYEENDEEPRHVDNDEIFEP